MKRPALRAAALGPAVVAAIAYVDPGNIATNTEAGSRFGYALLWVVVAATVAAGLVQYLAARTGLLTGRSLPQLMGERLGRRGRVAYWAQAEGVVIATDIAEVVGAAVGLHLLFGVPPAVGGVVAGAAGLGLLLLRDALGARALEVMSGCALAAIGAGFVVGLVAAPPGLRELTTGLVPSLPGPEAALLAAGIVGATVMPHAVYLHSGLAAEAAWGEPRPDPVCPARHPLLRSTAWAVAGAMLAAGAVNVSMLLVGASALRGVDDDTMTGLVGALGHRAGDGAATAFAVALLVSGVASTSVGTHTGSIVMAGLLHRRVPVALRRLAALVPAVLVLAWAPDPMTPLVLTQVILFVGLPFAVVPLLLAARAARPSVSGRGHHGEEHFQQLVASSGGRCGGVVAVEEGAAHRAVVDGGQRAGQRQG